MSPEVPSGRKNDLATPPAKSAQKVLPAGHLLAGSFEIQEVIGQGGMAVVYRAIQKSLNRPVAIKALHDRFARDPEFISRFEAEAGALASLSHPNIVNIIDRGHEGHCYFFVMECVEGKTLDQLIIQNALVLADWRRVVQACCEGLEYVHRRGVVHRDIKPSNILVGTENLIKIGDFGIAHIVRGGDGTNGTTEKPRAVGTAYYMAPEQISDPASVDQRADIYSLGVTFYKMLARQMPSAERFEAPSELNDSVPPPVDRVLAKAMARNRVDRYDSVRLFCDDMLKALRDTSTSIVSVLNTRRTTAGSALYTGADFRATPAPVDPKSPPSERKLKKPKSEAPRKPPASDTGPVSTSSLLNRLTPLPVAEKTPLPTASASAKTPPTPTPEALPTETAEAKPAAAGLPNVPVTPDRNHPLAKIAVIAALLAVALTALLVVALVKKARDSSAAAPPPIDPSVSISGQRQAILDDVIRERAAREAAATPETTPEAEVVDEPFQAGIDAELREQVAQPETPLHEENSP
ncbi:MAG: protein kinase [Candidatus Sumerlaeia bacterium]|nr:protein kinase [Candidatus Sumerlaeia bacterium]